MPYVLATTQEKKSRTPIIDINGNWFLPLLTSVFTTNNNNLIQGSVFEKKRITFML